MLIRAIAVITMFFGLMGLVNPGYLKKRMAKKMNRKIKFAVYGFMVVFVVIILASAVRAPGIISKIAALAGLVITIKIISLITTKSSEKLTEWIRERSLKFFRIWSLVLFVMGIMLFFSV